MPQKKEKPTAIITVFKDMSREWRFNARAKNMEIIFQSEAYTRKADAQRAARALSKYQFYLAVD